MKLEAIDTWVCRYLRFLLMGGIAIVASFWTATAGVEAAVLSSGFVPSVQASISPEITVYRDPSCRCCGGWSDRLVAEGFRPQEIPTSEMNRVKQQYQVPEDLKSCHTAILAGYVIEGHVPAEAIKRLMVEQPDVLGIAVPVGTPGMESGNQRDDFTVFSFDRQGRSKVFSRYEFAADSSQDRELNQAQSLVVDSGAEPD
jgi:hypothetical protein